jgi:hypothetical protein
VTIYGNWAVVWSDTDHVGIDRQHQLQVPLQHIRTGVKKVNAHRATSLDESVTNTIVFGSAKLLTAQVKAETNRQSLTDMVEAGLQGKALTLVDLAQTDRTVDVYMEDPASLWVAMYDAQGTPWDYELEARFRRTDGSAFPDWIVHQAYGVQGLLFSYVPGMGLADCTFTRATTATYVDINGATQTDGAAIDQPRDSHHQLIDTTWTRTLRLESAESELAYWTAPSVQALTFYVKFVEVSTLSGSGTVFHIGSATAATDPRLIVDSTGTYYRVTHDNGSATSTATLAVAPSATDVVEIRVVLNADGSVTIGQSIDGAAETTASDATTASHSTWADTRFYLNSAGSTGAGTADFLALKWAAGSQTMDHMRSP